MTPRERLIQAARGGTPDRKPVIQAIPGDPHPQADALAFTLGQGLPDAGEALRLALIPSMSARTLTERPDLLDLLHNSPDEGDAILQQALEKTKQDIQSAFEQGADGFIYVLERATPSAMSPMQYGGHYLELDREILTEFQEMPLTVLWIVGDDEPYLDFVSDLPAHFFAWDSGSGITPSQIAEMRQGALASQHPDSHAFLIHSESAMTQIPLAQEAR